VTTVTTPIEMATTEPYLGPRWYERDDEDRFYGRDVEARELYARTVANQAVLLYAQSGAGKTSLLHAGLRPLLERRGFDVLPVARLLNPGIDADRSGGNVFARSVIDYLGGGGHETIAAWVAARATVDGPRALVIDQFEELFTLYPERHEDRRAFVADLAAALHEHKRMRLVLAIREDYLGPMDTYVDLLPERSARYRLRRLDEHAALDAITGPVAAQGWAYEPQAAEDLVRDLRTTRVEVAPGQTVSVLGEFVEPVQLQVVCQQLWRAVTSTPRSQEERVIARRDLQRFGDASAALSRVYEQALVATSDDGREEEWRLREWFDTRLITPAGTRGTVYRGERDTEGIRNSAVDILEREHVIRGEMRSGARWYELTHDRLVDPVRMSNERARAARVTAGGLTAMWSRSAGRVAAAAAALITVGLGVGAAATTELGRTIALTLAVVALAAPAVLLCLRFTVSRVSALWAEYVMNLFHLGVDNPAALPEPPAQSVYHQTWRASGGELDDTGNLYVRKFEAIYGTGVLRAAHGYGRVRASGDALGPAVVVTLLCVIGWWAVLHPASDETSSLVDLLSSGDTVRSSALAAQAAFVGAYLVALGLLIQDYLGSSVRQSTFIGMALRLVLAPAGASLFATWAVANTRIEPAVLVLVAFVVGAFPATVLRLFRYRLSPENRTRDPDLSLTALDGLDIYSAAALQNEGIEDVSGLVTANLVDVILHLRLPVHRLLDWVDQGALHLRVPDDGDRRKLRQLGIRTASDLERLDHESAGARETLFHVLGPRLPAVLTMLRHDPNMRSVRHWYGEGDDDGRVWALSQASPPA
jgi:hypothetical protein